MTRLFGFALCVFALAGCRLGTRSEELVYKDLIRGLDDANAALLRVMDDATAQDARARINKMAPKLQELKLQKDQNDKIAPDEKLVELRKKYDPQLNAAITRIVNQQSRIRRSVPSATALVEDLQKLLEGMRVVPEPPKGPK
jgi:hypothetical protein